MGWKTSAGYTLLFVIGASLGCQNGGKVDIGQQRLAGTGTGEDTQIGHPLSHPLRLSPGGTFLVSPKPSPDGKWVAVSGKGGIGLFVLPTDGSHTLVTVEPGYRGPRAWTRDPLALNFGHGASRAWRPGHGKLQRGISLVDIPWDEEVGWFLGTGEAGDVYHQPKLGTVTLIRPNGDLEQRGNGLAWGATLAPKGGAVAWCTGRLVDAELHIWLFAENRVVNLGRGTQPTWSPNGTCLVFARPGQYRNFAGRIQVTRSELRLWCSGWPTPVTLNTPPGQAPMEPAFDPGGKHLYYADWASGAIFVGALPAGLFTEVQP